MRYYYRETVPENAKRYKPSLIFCNYMYFDTENYLADSVFVKNGVHVFFGKEYKHPDREYIAIFCRCFKKDEGKLIESLRELQKKMLICGHSDYLKECKKVLDEIKDTDKEGKADVLP